MYNDFTHGILKVGILVMIAPFQSSKKVYMKYSFMVVDTLFEEFELTYFQSNAGDDLMSDISICDGETADIEFPADNVNLGYTSYNWVFDNQLNLGSNGSLSISTEGLYTLNLYGCDTISDDFNLNVNQPNNTDYQFNDTLICEGIKSQ